MDMQLQGKVVFVAGASRGIGRAIAEACLAEGAKVALAARGREALEATHAVFAKQYGADRLWSCCGDLADTKVIEPALDAAERELGPLFAAVANIGGGSSPPGFDIADADWEKAMDFNLTSAFRLVRGALKRMVPRRAGAVLATSSIAGHSALGTPPAYGTAKAAMNQMVRELARLAAPSGVRVNAIAPGNIRFEGGFWDKMATSANAQAWKDWIEREVPMQRFGRPEEIGHVAAMLLSPLSSFLTGQVVTVDGGQTIGRYFPGRPPVAGS